MDLHWQTTEEEVTAGHGVEDTENKHDITLWILSSIRLSLVLPGGLHLLV